MNTVREILTNRCYTGEEVTYNKHKFSWNKKNQLRKTDEEKPDSEWIKLSFPTIIDEKQIADVQQKINYNRVISKRTPQDYSEKFLTFHILRCGECRAKLTNHSSGTKKYAYYVCPWRRSSEKKLAAYNKKRCDLPFLKYKAIDNQVFNQVINLIANPTEFTKLYTNASVPNNLEVQLKNLTLKKDALVNKLNRSMQIEAGASDPDLFKIYTKQRLDIEDEFKSVKYKILTLTNELSFYKNRNEQLDNFQKLLPKETMGDFIRSRKKIINGLTALPFNEKKKLLDAVISPETGGCVYISRLAEHHLLPEDFTSYDDTSKVEKKDDDKDISKDKDTLEKSMVIELDFTLDPFKIIQIIQGLHNNGFKIDRL